MRTQLARLNILTIVGIDIGACNEPNEAWIQRL